MSEKTIDEVIQGLADAADAKSVSVTIDDGAVTEMKRDILRSQCVAMMFANTPESVAISSLVIFGAYGDKLVVEAGKYVSESMENAKKSGALSAFADALVAHYQETRTARADLDANIDRITEQRAAAVRPSSVEKPQAVEKPKLVVDNTRAKRKPGRPRKTPPVPPAE